MPLLILMVSTKLRFMLFIYPFFNLFMFWGLLREQNYINTALTTFALAVWVFKGLSYPFIAFGGKQWKWINRNDANSKYTCITWHYKINLITKKVSYQKTKLSNKGQLFWRCSIILFYNRYNLFKIKHY